MKSFPNRPKGLEASPFRKRFRLSPKDYQYIEKIGIEKITSHAKDFVFKRLAKAIPKNDGKQTPFSGHPAFKAQHATATCCRGCLKKWYGIDKARPLSDWEVEGITHIITQWIEEKFGE